MYHLASEFGRRNCQHCGENLSDAQFTQDEATWAARADNCVIMKPVTMELFDDMSGDPQWTGFRFQPKRIEISDEALQVRISKITPLINRNGVLHRFKVPDLRRTAFTWDPKLIPGGECTMEEILVAPSFHGCAYYGFFKPSIAEVLAQMPDDPRINAVWLDSDRLRICGDGEGHLVPAHWGRITE